MQSRSQLRIDSALPIDTWLPRLHSHLASVGPWADAMLMRRSHGTTHPVHDFLFTYYSFAPGRLKQWVPSIGERLQVNDETLAQAEWFAAHRYGRIESDVFALDTTLLDERMKRTAGFVAELCANVLERPPRLRCFGLHEWAMVYGSTREQVRHNGYQLRMSPEELVDFVRSQSLVCTHYDAFRFFTPEARPLNALQPDLEGRLANEQGGCLHANMDLYKWATKLWPWSGSDLIAKAFLLALEGRDLDMRASPYDLRDLGYEPVRIETDEGRKQYQAEQQALAERAIPVRQELHAMAERIATHR